jgi:uncharacterized protein (DUF58 family)
MDMIRTAAPERQWKTVSVPPEPPARFVSAFFSASRAGLVLSAVMLGTAIWLRNGSFLVLGLAALSYSCIFGAALAGLYRRITIDAVLKHHVASVRQPNLLAVTVSGYSPTSAVLLDIDVALPAWVVKRHERTSPGSVTVFLDATRKGRYLVGDVCLTLKDPLRVFHLQRRYPAGLVLTVVPRPVPLERLHIALTSPLDGQRVRFAPNEDTSELTGVVPYASHPMSRIHWKMSAHTGQLCAKEFVPSATTTVVLVVDYTVQRDRSFTLELLDDTLSTAASSILQYAVDHKLPFGMASLGAEPTWSGVGHDRTHQLSCLSIIAASAATCSVQPHIVTDWLRRNVAKFPAQSQLVVLASALGEQDVVHLLRQREHFTRVTVVLFPEGTFLLPGEHRAPYFLHDTAGLQRLRTLQRVLRENGVELTIIGLNDPLSAVATA